MTRLTAMRSALLAVAACAAAVAPAQEAVVSTLDGRRLVGGLQDLSPSGIVLDASGGAITVPVGEVSRLKLSGDPRPTNEAHTLGRAELVDGSRVAITNVTADAQEFQLKLAPPLAASDGAQDLSVAYSSVKAVVFRTGSAALARQWESIRTVDATADLIVVARNEGAVLDYLEGIVTQITPDKLRIELSGQPRAVSRAKVYGVVYFRPDAPPEAEAPVRVAMRSGAVIQATRVSMRDEATLEVSTPLGFGVRLPLAACEEVDYSRGRVAYLSDLEPAESDWRPYFPPPGGAELADQWGRPRRDRSYTSGPLTLRTPSGETTTYAKGLAIRSRGELVYDVPPGFAWLRATVGLDPTPAVSGSVELRIEGDQQVLFAETITSADAPRELELPVDEVSRLRVLVDYAEAGDAGDNLHLGNARFTK